MTPPTIQSIHHRLKSKKLKKNKTEKMQRARERAQATPIQTSRAHVVHHHRRRLCSSPCAVAAHHGDLFSPRRPSSLICPDFNAATKSPPPLKSPDVASARASLIDVPSP
jgi:hypothetical protein